MPTAISMNIETCDVVFRFQTTDWESSRILAVCTCPATTTFASKNPHKHAFSQCEFTVTRFPVVSTTITAAMGFTWMNRSETIWSRLLGLWMELTPLLGPIFR